MNIATSTVAVSETKRRGGRYFTYGLVVSCGTCRLVVGYFERNLFVLNFITTFWPRVKPGDFFLIHGGIRKSK